MSANNAQSFLDLFYRSHTYPEDWLEKKRHVAIKHIEGSGLATTRNDDWRYTDTRAICRKQYKLADSMHAALGQDTLESFRFSGLECNELVFINGCFSETLSNIDGLPDGVLVKNMEAALADANTADLLKKYLSSYDSTYSFALLNTAFIKQGAFIMIPDQLVLQRPIHILYLSSGVAARTIAMHPRNLVIIGAGAKASIIERYAGLDESTPYFNNPVSEIFIKEGAALTHYKVQQEAISSDHIGHLFFNQEQDSRLLSYSIALGGRLARTDINAKLNKPGAEVTMHGLYIVDGAQHIDNRSCVHHISPNTCSSEDYRGILNGHGRGVFNGKVIIHKDAQQTQAHQENRNLLLSKDAEINTKPTLEIYADEVACNHSATVGQMDEQMLFYLYSRAISEDIAKGLLTFSFAAEVTNQIESAPIRQQLEQLVAAKLPYTVRVEERI